MYPTTTVTWHDNSAITPSTVADAVDNIPLYLAAASFDRGPEDLHIVSGQDFYDLYGSSISFSKHGQPALQVKNIIDGGGSVLLKRVVAEDATLANTILVSNLSKVVVARPATEGDEEESKVTIKDIKALFGVESQETPSISEESKFIIETNHAVIKWTAVSVTGCKSFDDVKAKTTELTKEDSAATITVDDESGNVTVSMGGDYPLIVISDNGRGTSNKTVKISPDYTQSKDMDNMFYSIIIYNGTSRLERTSASINPYCVFNNIAYGIMEDTATQVKMDVDYTIYDKYFDKLIDITGLDEATLRTYDIIFGTDNRGSLSDVITLDPESVDLNSTYGVEIQNGTNGEFGDKPFGTDAYNRQLISFFKGEMDDSIWDQDAYKIAAIFDANYAFDVKEAISQFVTFREDCVFFRDLGANVKSYASILDAKKKFTTNNKFIADYYTTYQVYDPETKRRITVTMMYDFARVMISHFSNGAYRPVAGLVNNMILPNAIEGTINFTPRVTPDVDQKELLNDLRVNYAIFQNGQCIVQSLYTSQQELTQLSYVNNVLAIQEVVRSVRTNCPKQRFTFVSNNDFSYYSDAANNVLREFKSNFEELRFEYDQDPLLVAQKVFYAAIYFRFKNWAQAEHIDVFAMPVEE